MSREDIIKTIRALLQLLGENDEAEISLQDLSFLGLREEDLQQILSNLPKLYNALGVMQLSPGRYKVYWVRKNKQNITGSFIAKRLYQTLTQPYSNPKTFYYEELARRLRDYATFASRENPLVDPTLIDAQRVKDVIEKLKESFALPVEIYDHYVQVKPTRLPAGFDRATLDMLITRAKEILGGAPERQCSLHDFNVSPEEAKRFLEILPSLEVGIGVTPLKLGYYKLYWVGESKPTVRERLLSLLQAGQSVDSLLQALQSEFPDLTKEDLLKILDSVEGIQVRDNIIYKSTPLLLKETVQQVLLKTYQAKGHGRIPVNKAVARLQNFFPEITSTLLIEIARELPQTRSVDSEYIYF